ncbi:MAG: hypothetical protein M0Z59_01510 [Nitrospiraceae bacterium]|nr:hypothetical protein [Nitrospiraceae bacterium]
MEWLMTLRDPSRPGEFSFCRQGALFQPGPKAGLGISCLALKISSMLGCLDRFSADELEGWTEHISSFQSPSGRTAGYFEDDILLKELDGRAGWFRKDWAARRAETRQACAALMCTNSTPRFAISHLPDTAKKMKKYVRGLDWSQPWAAGSHASHMIFFLNLNARVFGQTEAKRLFLPVILEEIDRLQDPETGSWFSGRPPAEQVVNGAMKVITGYACLDKPFRHPERLIDTCLSAINDEHGCNNADIIHVLYHCGRYTSHRRQEIRDFAWKRLHTVRSFHQTDGGFSYFQGRAQTHYYGVRMSMGLPESDVHGTTLFVWALVMIGEILGFGSELGWKVPVT